MICTSAAADCGTPDAGGGAIPPAEADAVSPGWLGAGVDTVTSSRPGMDANCTTKTINQHYIKFKQSGLPTVKGQ